MKPRRAAAALLGALLLVSAPPGRAQVPDVPRGDATLRGRVVHAETGTPVGGAEVVLYALPASAPPGMRSVVAGPDGSFTLSGIDGDPRTTYLVGARHEGVSHPGARVTFAAGERDKSVEIAVSAVRPERGDARATGLQVRIDWVGDQIAVSETLAFENPSAQTVLLPESGPPLVEVGLPEAAGELSGPLGVVPQGLVRAGSRLAWYGPLFPGSHEIEYRYPVPAGEGPIDLGRRVPDDLPLTVLVAAGGADLDAPALAAGEPTQLLGRSYQSYTGVAAGRLALALTLPAARRDPDAVRVAEVRWIGDLDGAALTVREEHVLAVEGDTPVLAGDAPLHRIPVPEGAREMRFAARDSGSSLAPAEGGLAVLGPLVPGETVIEVAYRLSASEPLALERRLESHVPLFSLYLADNGNLDVSSRRLHRRRPVRTPDRTYVHFEAFEVGSGEALDLAVATLPPRRRLGPQGALVAIAALAAGAVWLLLAPLRGRAEETVDARESAAHREREALYEALRDLEHDFETGKVDAADHGRMRAELRARALRSLAEEERAGTEGARDSAATPHPSPPAAPAARRCPQGHDVAPHDRFCSQCGARLPEAGPGVDDRAPTEAAGAAREGVG